MPLPIITTIGGAIGGAIAHFIKKFSLKSLILPIQMTVSYSIIVGKIAFVAFVLNLGTSIYNLLNSIITTTIPSMIYESTNTYIQTMVNVLSAAGVFRAMTTVYDLFSSILVSFLILLATRFVYKNLKELSDELFKIGVLIQQ
jgi:hypothetical protein